MINKDEISLILCTVGTIGVLVLLSWFTFEIFGWYGLLVPLLLGGTLTTFIVVLITQPYEPYQPQTEKKEED